jgi:hypothetical protein
MDTNQEKISDNVGYEPRKKLRKGDVKFVEHWYGATI